MGDVLPPLLLVDKPKGITSYDVIRRLQRRYGRLKMGHAGTLDPNASGLMLVGVGQGTKALTQYVGLDKVYDAEIWLGIETVSGDTTGRIVREATVPPLDDALVKSTLASLVGKQVLPVSAFSAIKKNGVPLYKQAHRAERKGERVEDIPLRPMEVYRCTIQNMECADGRCVVSVCFHVGSGTYIRSLAVELGKRLGFPATLAELRRTRVGDFSINDPSVLKIDEC